MPLVLCVLHIASCLLPASRSAVMAVPGFPQMGVRRDGRWPRGDAGVYCLVLRVPRVSRVKVRRLGRCVFRPGWYVYTGSAKRNLVARLTRHLRRQKLLHWHIDYLRPRATVREIWVWPWVLGVECRTHRMVRRMAKTDYPCQGFGASDCRCRAHLVSFPSRPVPPESRPPFRYRARGIRLIRVKG